MRQPVLALVHADTGIRLDVIAAPAGSPITLRADFTADPPSGEVSYVWKVYPKAALVFSDYRTEPDFLRYATVRRDGVVYVTAYDEWGFALQSQTVKIRPATLTDPV